MSGEQPPRRLGRHAELTPREAEVWRHYKEGGRSVLEIAVLLGLSKTTVQAYFISAREKVRVALLSAR